MNLLSTSLSLGLAVSLLLAVALLTLLERKILGYMQNRKGPNVVGPFGTLQPIADGVKLLTKEPIRPSTSSQTLFLLSPTLALILALLIWAPLSLPTPISDMNLDILFILAISSLMTYTILGSGWASNSKYALLGALRSIAQTISYEVTLALILLNTILMSGNYNLKSLSATQETVWLMFPMWPLMMMWFVSTLAETNRSPFDLAESESELVSGFNVEYAGGPFAMFFLAEYMNILMMNTITSIAFLGATTFMLHTNTIYLVLKAMTLTTMFLWIRASYPRFRYDQLMHLVWKNFLPLTLALTMWHIAFPITLLLTPPML